MGKVPKGAPEEGRTGRYGDVVYYQRDGVTYFRSMPIYPTKRVMKTPTRKKQNMRFGLVQKYFSLHSNILNMCFDSEGGSKPVHQFQKLNSKFIHNAIDALLDRCVAEDREPKMKEVEQAVCAYAQAHPNEMVLVHKKGFEPVYFTGTWPTAVPLVPIRKKRSTIVVDCEETHQA